MEKELISRLKDAVEKLGFGVAEVPAKSVGSSARKLLTKNWINGKNYTISDFADNARTTITMNSLDDIKAAMTELVKVLPEYEIEFKNNQLTGYIGFHVTATIDDVKCEIQLSTPSMYDVKERSEAMYADWRDRRIDRLTQEEYDRFVESNELSKELWEDYRIKFGLTPDVLERASDTFKAFELRISSTVADTHLPLTNFKVPATSGNIVARTTPSSVNEYVISDIDNTSNESTDIISQMVMEGNNSQENIAQSEEKQSKKATFSMRAPSTIEDAVLGAEIGNRRKQAALDSTAQARAEQRMLRNQQVADDMALAGQMSDMRKEAARSRRTQQELQDRLDTQAARAEQNLLRQDQTALGRQMGDTRTALDRQRRQIENDAMRGMKMADVRARTEQRDKQDIKYIKEGRFNGATEK